MSRLTILGTGGYTLPVVGNRALMEFIGTPENSAWEEETIGVDGRSLNFDCAAGCKRTRETGLDWAERAARQAMAAAGLHAAQVDQLCLTTCTPTHPRFMADAIELQRRLGLRPATVVSQTDGGCAGLAKVLQEVQAYAHCASSRWTALVVAVNDASSFLSGGHYRRIPAAWLAPALFADGAGAAVLGEGGGPRLVDVCCTVDGNPPRFGFRGAAVAASANTVHACVLDGGGLAAQFGVGVRRARKWLAERWGIHTRDVQRWYIHQANYRVIAAAITALGLAPERVPYNVHRIGNTGSASTLLLLDEDVRNGCRPARGPSVFLWLGAGMMEGGALFIE
jgi:3-oxoacyl-[acyl-carrier-protein] synthase-3